MAFKFDMDHKRVQAFIDKDSQLLDAIDKARAAAAASLTLLNTAIQQRNELASEVTGWIEDEARDHRDKFDGFSDRWQASDKGEATNQWIQELESFCADDLELFDLDELFDDIDEPTTIQEQLEGLPEEPSE